MRAASGLRRVVARLAHMLPRAVILLYHRVATVALDPQWLCVRPELFAEHLEVLRRDYSPISLHEMLRLARRGTLPPRAVAVTFDDGYADNLHFAKPILHRFDVPATVFVASGQVGSIQEFWWDDLARVLLATRRLPTTLSLSIGGTMRSWDLGAPEQEESGPWHVLMQADPTPRHTAYRELAGLLRGATFRQRTDALCHLVDWAGVGQAGRPEYRALGAEETHELGKDQLVEVGAHTVSHPALSQLSVLSQHAEIVSSKLELERVTGHPVISFAYPFGTKVDYTNETVRLLRGSGFTSACSNFPGVVHSLSDPYQLPRFLVRDWSRGEFSSHLKNWFAA